MSNLRKSPFMFEPLNIEDAFKQVAIEIKQMVLDAIASVNKLADEISEEFSFEHQLVMDALDIEERLRDAELYIQRCLSPYHEVKDWFEAQPDSEIEAWYRAYEFYQYGEHDMDVEDDFELCVMEFLRSQDVRLT